MTNKWYDETYLEAIELLAEYEGLISSEDELSEAFDEGILPGILAAHGQPGVEFTDTIMIEQAFNDWTDGLCKKGQLHPEQYDNYTYVGKFSE